MAQCYLVPMTMESGPTKCSTRVSRNPDSFIQEEQSAPVQSKQMRTASAVRIDHRSGQQYVVHGSGDELGRPIRSIHSAVSRSYSAKGRSRVPVLSHGRIRWKRLGHDHRFEFWHRADYPRRHCDQFRRRLWNWHCLRARRHFVVCKKRSRTRSHRRPAWHVFTFCHTTAKSFLRGLQRCHSVAGRVWFVSGNSGANWICVYTP